MGFYKGVFFLCVCVYFFGLSVFLVFARESYVFSVISLGFAWLFLGKTLFLYGFRVISLGFFWVFRRENTIFLRLPCHFLRFSEGQHTLPWIFLGQTPIFLTFSHSLGFHKENIRYLGYSSGKSDFPHIFAFWTDFVLFLLLS